MRPGSAPATLSQRSGGRDPKAGGRNRLAALLIAALSMTACASLGTEPDGAQTKGAQTKGTQTEGTQTSGTLAGDARASYTLESGPMEQILHAHPGLEGVVDAAPGHRLQGVLGLVEEGPDGPRLVQHGFRLDAEYFYPASSVKLFAAVAALERLAELRRETGLALDADTPLVFHPLFEDETLEDADDSNLDGGRITVRHEIRKLFLVSDNRAFNRLYELVGQDRLAASLTRAGLAGARIVHRLSEFRSAADNRRSPRIDFLAPPATGALAVADEAAGARVLYTLPERTSAPLAAPPPIPGLLVGSAFLAGGEKVEEPLDFAPKNRFPLAELQRGLCMVVLPEVDCGGPGFALGEADRALLLEAMTRYPGESTNPVYDPAEYPDDYGKFLLPGLERVLPKERLSISNKVGQAYGFTTENAWIVDRDHRPRFLPRRHPLRQRRRGAQ